MTSNRLSALFVAEFLFFAGIHLCSAEIISFLGLTGKIPEMPIIKTAWLGFAIVILIITWLKIRGANLGDYGLKSPKPWWRTLLIAIVGVVAAIAVSSLTDPIIEEWFGPTNTTAFADVKGNLAIVAYLLPLVWLFAAFGEEFFYRGFLMGGIAMFLGGSRVAWIIALIVQAIIFGFGHQYQGPAGMIGTGLYALVFGLIYLVAGRNLWAPAIAHGLLDTLGFVLLYLGVIEATG